MSIMISLYNKATLINIYKWKKVHFNNIDSISFLWESSMKYLSRVQQGL